MDVEPDITRYVESGYLGIEKGLVAFLDLLKDHGITIDFFVTADVCRKFPEIMKRMMEEGHRIGNHGFDHSIPYYCQLSYQKQLADISKAGNEIEKIIDSKLKMFRAPNFSANQDTIRVLEKLDYDIDSSVLPGRHVKKWRMLTMYDFRNAPRVPYHPSSSTITDIGESPILEIPLTINPNLDGAPIGMGYLNISGLQKVKTTIDAVDSEYITFLIHPWELIDLRSSYPGLPDWVYDICSSDLKPLSSLLGLIQKDYDFTSLKEIRNVAETT